MNLIASTESPYSAAKRAYSLVLDVQRQAERLKAADESTLGHAPDKYSGEVGRVEALFGLSEEGYAKFDPATGEIEQATMVAGLAHRPSVHSQKTSIQACADSVLYSYSDTSGLTSSTVSVDRQSGRYTLEDKIMGVTVRKHDFGALGEGRWTDEWPKRGPCDDLQSCPQ
jgi:hypothetical protein